MRRICLALVAVVLGGAIAFGASAAVAKTKLSLVAYSTPKDAYAKIISAFDATQVGKDVSFSQSYGASGDQARAVKAGLPADIVNFSLEPDVTLLVKAGLVAKNWKKDRYHGIVTNSVVVFVVRDGNPKHIRSWNDLVRNKIQVITPNPFSSGGARWNVLAAYGAMRKQGRSDKQAIKYLSQLFHHVPVQDKSARNALQTFTSGKGDVLLTYENEAIYANKRGVHTDYVVPRQTILIESPVALTKDGAKHKEAKAFLSFLQGPRAQAIFADQGYRSVIPGITRSHGFPRPKGLFTIRQLGLGGWNHVEKRFFDPNNGIMAKIERSLGH
jgi:sulfate/thiosulfate transport system substrate-binding protein